MQSAPIRTIIAGAGLILLAGCEDNPRVVAYTVPKAARPASPATGTAPMAASPGMTQAVAEFDTPTWVAPQGWRAQPSSPMRKGDWKIGPGGAEALMAVTVFAGDVGGLPANVNRWAQQLGMPALSAEQRQKAVSPRPLEGSPDAVLVRLSHDGRATLAISAPHGGATWFFKLSGPASTVAEAESDFQKFADSVRFPASR